MNRIQNKLLLFLTIFIMVFGFFFQINKSMAAASFSTSGGGSLTTNQTFTVNVTANRSSAYNAVTVNVNFSNLIYVSANASSGWTAVSGPSRSGNTISFSGAMLGTSVTGAKAVLSLTFKAPTIAGTATISSSGNIDGTGVGTGAESGSGNTVTYSIKLPATPAPATPTPKPAPNAASLTSSTHPDQSKWYKSTELTMNWNIESGVTDFSYILDSQQNTIPDDTSEGLLSSKIFTDLKSGTNYVHIKAKNDIGWGATSNFTINIDNSAPDPFTPTSVKNNDGSYTLYFSTSDNGSGIASYNLVADGKDLGISNSGITIPAGTKSVIVTATDRSGNAVSSTVNLENSSVTVTSSIVATTIAASSNSNSNSIIAGLIIALIIFIVYAIIISILYSMDKRSVNKPESKLDVIKSSEENLISNIPNISDIDESPFKKIKLKIEPEAKQEIKPKVKSEVKQEIKPEDKQVFKPEAKQEIKIEDKQIFKPEAKQEIKIEDKQVFKPEAKQEIKIEDKQIFKPEAKQEIKIEDKQIFKPEAKSEVKPELKTEDKKVIETEAKPEEKSK